MKQLMFGAVKIGGEGFINQLLTALIIGICVALVYGAGRWFLKIFNAPPIGLNIWNGFFVLVGLVVIINFLLGLTGNPLIKW